MEVAEETIKEITKEYEINHISGLDEKQIKYFTDGFAKHEILEHIELENWEIIDFGEKDSGFYHVKIIFDKQYGNIMISGDIGDATYGFNRHNVSLESLSCVTDIQYFLGKCRSSEVGQEYVEWDKEVAKKQLKDDIFSLIDHDQIGDSTERDDIIFEFIGESLGCDFMEYDFNSIFNDQANFIEWINTHGYTIDNEAYDWVDFGKIPNGRVYLHLYALKLAIKTFYDNKMKK